MKVKLILYILSMLISTFAVSGINIEVIIKKNHVWEARFLSLLLIFSFTYLLANLLFDLLSLNLF